MTNGEFRLLELGTVIYRFEDGKKVFGYVSAIYRDYPNLFGFSKYKNEPWASWIPLDNPAEFHVASKSETVLWKLENA